MKITVNDLVGIQNITGCTKPCHYKRYERVGGKKKTSKKSDHFIFSLWTSSNKVFVETEVLLYPLTSLVAEFGGTLGLFLGFSFMWLWDAVEAVITWALKFKSTDLKK